MSTVIFRTMAPLLAVVMFGFSLIVLLRGHNWPGGGFVGGLIAASAVVVHSMAEGVGRSRRLMRVNPLAISGLGVLVGIVSGLVSLPSAMPFLTGLWFPENVFGTPGLFDIGVYLTVFGAATAIALGLEDGGEAG